MSRIGEVVGEKGGAIEGVDEPGLGIWGVSVDSGHGGFGLVFMGRSISSPCTVVVGGHEWG